MSRFWDIVLCVAVPLAWGVGADVLFESLRRWRARRVAAGERSGEGSR